MPLSSPYPSLVGASARNDDPADELSPIAAVGRRDLAESFDSAASPARSTMRLAGAERADYLLRHDARLVHDDVDERRTPLHRFLEALRSANSSDISSRTAVDLWRCRIAPTTTTTATTTDADVQGERLSQEGISASRGERVRPLDRDVSVDSTVAGSARYENSGCGFGSVIRDVRKSIQRVRAEKAFPLVPLIADTAKHTTSFLNAGSGEGRGTPSSEYSRLAVELLGRMPAAASVGELRSLSFIRHTRRVNAAGDGGVIVTPSLPSSLVPGQADDEGPLGRRVVVGGTFANEVKQHRHRHRTHHKSSRHALEDVSRYSRRKEDLYNI